MNLYVYFVPHYCRSCFLGFIILHSNPSWNECFKIKQIVLYLCLYSLSIFCSYQHPLPHTYHHSSYLSLSILALFFFFFFNLVNLDLFLLVIKWDECIVVKYKHNKPNMKEIVPIYDGKRIPLPGSFRKLWECFFRLNLPTSNLSVIIYLYFFFFKCVNTINNK